MTPRPAGMTLAQVIAEKALADPASPAIWFDGTVIDYAALHAMAWRRAAALRAMGLQAGSRVGILLGNEPEWVALALATSALGITLAPLNTWYKPAELAWTMRHCQLQLLIAQRQLLNTDYGAIFGQLLKEQEFEHLVDLVMIGEPVSGALDHANFLELATPEGIAGIDAIAAAVEPDSAAYVLYTSGSTAEPKGVILNHRGVVENGFDLGQRRAISAQDRTWLGAPLFHALGATNALPATLTAGACLVLQGAFEAGKALDVIEASGATVYCGTGNMSRAIVDHPQFTPQRVSTLNKGNAGPGAEYKRLTLVEMGIVHAVPAYGLTETYGNAATGAWDDPLDIKMTTDGIALEGQEIVVVDPSSGASLGPGEVGLVLVRGNVTPGYLDNPEETAKVFRSDGFFNTGDFGTLDEKGRLTFHSRLKDVIKTAGSTAAPLA